MKKAAKMMIIISSADTWCEQKKKQKKNLCYEDFHAYVQLIITFMLHNLTFILWDLDP